MTDSNHAPLTERDRLAWVVRDQLLQYHNCSHEPSDETAWAIADAILADPTYARAAEMREVLRECADDLESFVNAEYHLRDGTIHPAMQHKFDRDMAPILRARALVGGGKP